MRSNKAGPSGMSRISRIKNGVLILIMAACSVSLLFFGASSRLGKASSGRIRVLVNGEIYTEQPLRNGETIVVTQPDGSENVIMMTEDGFYMLSANCHNQDCVRQGEVTAKNHMFRSLGTSVICIPNRVEVQLVLADEGQYEELDLPDA